MVQAYYINSQAQTVTEISIASLESLRSHVGGWIELAYMLENGDHLYVDEEGMLKKPRYFFAIGLPLPRSKQAYAGNGVWVGREQEGDDEGMAIDCLINLAPQTSIETLRNAVKFGFAP